VQKLGIGLLAALLTIGLSIASADAASKKKSGKSKGKVTAAKVEKVSANGGPVGVTCVFGRFGSVFGFNTPKGCV
jgi:hypothetical protein